MKYNSIGEQLIAKAKELDPSYTPDKFNDMSEALDVILNKSDSSSSIFDITPYLTSETSMSIEGYNALREFVTSNKGGIVKFNMDEHVMYITCFAVSSDSLIFNYYFVFDNGEYDTTFTAILVNSEGNIAFNNLTLYQVLANPVDTPTDVLSKIKINGIVYSIPVGEDYSTEISTLNGRVDTLENNVDVLLGYDINSLDNRITRLEDDTTLNDRVDSLENEVSQSGVTITSLESRVNLLESKSTSFAQASDVNTLDSRVSGIETTIGDINSILDNINGEVI